MTGNAKLILDMINHSDEHLTAEQIYLRLKESGSGIVLATVYNNLSALCEQGLIRKVYTGGSSDRYDRILIRHDHMVCTRCGRITDIVLEDYTEQLKKVTGLDSCTYDLRINYVCEDCRKREK